MVLAVNIGNSTITMGGFDHDRIYFTASIETRKHATWIDHVIAFRQILSLYQVSQSDISGAAISSVVPAVTDGVKKALEHLKIQNILTVSSGTKTGLKIKKQNSNLGTDFVCMAVEVMHSYPLPCVLVSLGTATTFCAVDAEGCFLGTSIAPGIELSLQALKSYTSRLPETELEAPKKLLGGNTADSIKSGLIYGTASMVDGMCQRYQDEWDTPAACVVTGRYAPVILPYCQKEYQYDETLLLKGLYRIYCRNSIH